MYEFKKEKKVKTILKILLFICIFTISAGSFLQYASQRTEITAEAAESMLPEAFDNLRISLRKTSELITTDKGYTRIFYDGKKICIEEYDKNFNITGKKTIAMELDVWGGFYKGSDAYYIVEGRNNTAQDDGAEVIRVIKYNKAWKKVGESRITGNKDLFGGDVRYPFNSGTVEFAEYKDKLYIVTGHQSYVDQQYGQGHQGLLVMEVDRATMQGSVVMCDNWHSFAQYIDSDGTDLYLLEKSEGSRYTALSKINTDKMSKNRISVFDYGGKNTSAWAIACYASVDGIALSSDNILCLGTSIDQSQYDNVNYSTPHNIYLTVTPKSDFSKNATKQKWITSYEKDKSFTGVNITKISDDRFLIAWEEHEDEQEASADDPLSSNILHYLFVDGNGNIVSREFTAAAAISDCQPVLSGSDVVFYSSSINMVNFYSINTSTGSFSKKTYHTVGNGVSWELKDGVLTFAGSGDILYDSENRFRTPISSIGGDSYSTYDNAWKPVRKHIKKIVIKSGVKSICKEAFIYFTALEEADIKPGVTSIGGKAFYGCENLDRIIIPSTVTNIGEDILWTGSTWISSGNKVIYADVYCEPGSKAEKYASTNKISYQYTTPELTSSVNAAGNPELSWEMSYGMTRYFVSKYEIWRSVSKNSGYSKIADTDSLSWTDKTAVPGTTYYYKVCAVQHDGHIFPFSNICSEKALAPVTGVKLDVSETTIARGAKKQLKAAISPSNATNKNVKWKSSNTDVAVVDSSGTVTAKSVGNATITVTTEDGNKTASCKVTVNVPVTGIKLSKNEAVVNKGAKFKLTYTITPSDATDKKVTWSSSDPRAVTVDSSGNVTAVYHGESVITVRSSNGKTAKCTVKVNFTDVTKSTDWYFKPVYWAAEKGIATGANGTFNPAGNCTREQAVTFLWRMAGKPDPGRMTSKFSDVKDSKGYSYKAIMWGSEKGIITGINGKFHPADTCTREQIVTMLWRLAGKPAPKSKTSKFKDVTDSKRYSYKAILWAAEKGITTGQNGLFAPGKTCTRAEIVTFIYRYQNKK